MDWRAANEQRQDARWRVFLMFIAMALLIIRTGLVSRGALAACPPASRPQDAEPSVSPRSPSTSPAELYQATLAVLCLAEAAGRLFILKGYEVWELMNQPRLQPALEQPLRVDSLCERPGQRLDTS